MDNSTVACSRSLGPCHTISELYHDGRWPTPWSPRYSQPTREDVVMCIHDMLPVPPRQAPECVSDVDGAMPKFANPRSDVCKLGRGIC